MDANQDNQERMEAKLDTTLKKMMAMIDSHHERIMALLGSQRKWNLTE
jgi:hypothetical protein